MVTAPARRRRGAALGLVADALLGEPPVTPHPVAAFGSVMHAVERRVWRDHRLAGVGHAAVGVAVGAAAGVAVRSTAGATDLSVAGNALAHAAIDVHRALVSNDLDRARALLPALVGRDPSRLDAPGIARAAIESVAENTVDAVVAPALWAAIAGAPGALAYRAVNTLDAMVGHRSARYERYGWASARADDAANFVPARVTAALVAAVRPGAAGAVRRTVRREAPSHPSPNSGGAEAAFAAALGLTLGGAEVRYGERVEHRPALGDGRPAVPDDIPRAVALSRHVAVALAAMLFVWPRRPSRHR